MKIDDFTKAQKELLRIVDKFPKEKQSLVFYGDWTIKEVVGHISAWDLYFTNLLKNFSKSKQTDFWGSINKFNEKEVESRKSKNFNQIKSELKLAGNQFVKVYKSLSEKSLSQKIWKDKKYTSKDILKIEIDHYESQFKQIDKRMHK